MRLYAAPQALLSTAIDYDYLLWLLTMAMATFYCK